MSNDAAKYREDEKTRPCTTCRMPVSILATRCRYCGTELGRPREETRSLSSQDLGGETIKHYAPSSNVMDALESFRTEQAAQQRKIAEGPDNPDMPELDARSKALASAVRAGPASGSNRRARGFDWGDYGRYALGGVTAVVLVAVAITVIPRFTTGQAQDDGFVNRAPDLIAAGATPLEVLSAAVEGVRMAPGPDSTEWYTQASAMVRGEVMGLIDAGNWSRQKLYQASRLSNHAAETDPRLQALKNMIDSEVDAYNIVLLGVDTGTGEIRYRLARGGGEEVAGRGDLILGRFEASRVTSNSVRLRDRMRNGRELMWSVGGQPAARQQ